MFKTIQTIVMAALCLNFSSNAQEPIKPPPLNNQGVIGKVLSSSTNEPLPGAVIKVTPTKQTIVSNDKGEFILSLVNGTYNLSVHYLNHKTKNITIQVPLKASIIIRLDSDENALDEIQIIGYGKVAKKLNTGSVSSVTAKDIVSQSVQNPLSALQGRMPGVQIEQATGIPGGAFKVEIRGQNSLRNDIGNNGNEPLYVIDGVPYPSNSLSSGLLSGGILAGAGNPLININPGDIDRVDILKDADATAIYGSRGANGVILITTKSGQKGKIKLDVSTYAGFGNVAKRMELLNSSQYLEMRQEAFKNDGMVPGAAAYDLNGKWDQNNYTDWQELILGGTAQISNIQANISGGNLQTNFLMGIGNSKEGTVFPSDLFNRRTSFKFSLTHKDLDDKLLLNINASYAFGFNNLIQSSLVSSLQTPPVSPALYDTEGNLNWADGTFSNPLRALERKYKSNAKTLISNSLLRYRIYKRLEFKATMGYSSMLMDEVGTTPITYSNPMNSPGPENRSSLFNNSRLDTWIMEPQLNYSSKLGNGKLTFLIGSTFEKSIRTTLTQGASGFSSDQLLENIGSANQVVVHLSEKSEYKYNAIFGRINYNYLDKYLFNLTARRDGSTRFGPGKQFSNFYAAGIGYIFSGESWFKNLAPLISFGKIRTSYGITGNDQIGDYQFLETWAPTYYTYGGTGGLAPVRLFNSDFAWEVNKKFEIALELGFLNNNLLFNTNYYRNRSSNQLVGYALAPSVGFTSVQSNLNALIENSGLEFSFSFFTKKTRKFSWDISANLTIPQNRLIQFPGLEGSSYANIYAIGKSLNLAKSLKFTGMDAQTGIYTYRDIDGSGTISSPNDLVNDKDIGQRYYGGLQNSFGFKNFNLEVFFQFVNQTAKNYSLQFLNPGSMFNQPDYVLERWRQAGDPARVQKYTQNPGSKAGIAYTNYRNSTASIEDASFIRLKSVSFSYQLPKVLVDKIRLQACRFFVQGQNLLTFSKYRGLDPETRNVMPPLSIFTAGISITF